MRQGSCRREWFAHGDLLLWRPRGIYAILGVYNLEGNQRGHMNINNEKLKEVLSKETWDLIAYCYAQSGYDTFEEYMTDMFLEELGRLKYQYVDLKRIHEGGDHE